MSEPAETALAAVTGLHHVGIVVDSLDDALRFLTEALGLQLVFRHVDGDGGLAVAMVRCGAVRLELIEPLEESERERRLGGAAARIEHLALTVADLAGLSAALRRLGVRFDGDAVDHGLGPMRTTAAETTDGIAYQLLELRSRG